MSTETSVLTQRTIQGRYQSSNMAIPEEVKEVLQLIGQGACALFATSYLADELTHKHDCHSRGERLIAGEMLHTADTMLGNSRSWFDGTAFETMIRMGRAYDIVCILDAFDNMDVSAYLCYQECGGDDDCVEWMSFVKWRQETARLSRISVLLKQWQVVCAVKLYAIRFRKRVHMPDGAVYTRRTRTRYMIRTSYITVVYRPSNYYVEKKDHASGSGDIHPQGQVGSRERM